MKRHQKLILISIVFFINYSLDRLTKVLTIHFLQGQDPVNLFGNLIILDYAENNGAFLSMGSYWPETLKVFIFIVLPLIACVLGVFYCYMKDLGKLPTILIVTIAAGGIGNIQDRIFNNGFVIDFLNFGIGTIRTGVLNVADISVTFGALFYLLYEVRESRNKKVSI